MAEIHDLVDENDIDCQRKVYMYMWVNIRMVYIMTNKAHVVQLEESLCVKGRTSVCKSPFVFPLSCSQFSNKHTFERSSIAATRQSLGEESAKAPTLA